MLLLSIASNYSYLDYAVGAASHAPPMCRTTLFVTNHGNVILSCNPAFIGLAASASFAMGQPFSLQDDKLAYTEVVCNLLDSLLGRSRVSEGWSVSPPGRLPLYHALSRWFKSVYDTTLRQ